MIGAVVLAAGEASRFGSPKQQLMLARRAASSARELRGRDRRRRGRLRAGDGRARRALRGVAAGDGSVPALRPRGAAGRDAEAAVVVLADGPDLAPEAIDRVIAAWRGGAGDALAASYGGVRGHPVLLERSVWNDDPRRRRPRARRAVRSPRRPQSSWRRRLPRGLQAAGSLSAASFAFSSGDISSRQAVFT